MPFAILADVSTRAAAAEDPREAEGRAKFAKGDYDGALDLFASLFAANADPVYLRNIGRCYQKLRKPQKAIDAFEEYLRRSPSLGAEERVEIEGFIAEMESLRKEQASASPGALTGSVPPHGLQPAGMTAPPSMLASTSGAELSVERRSRPYYRTWWFWTGAGSLLLAGALTAVLLSGGGSSPPCAVPGPTCVGP